MQKLSFQSKAAGDSFQRSYQQMHRSVLDVTGYLFCLGQRVNIFYRRRFICDPADDGFVGGQGVVAGLLIKHGIEK